MDTRYVHEIVHTRDKSAVLGHILIRNLFSSYIFEIMAERMSKAKRQQKALLDAIESHDRSRVDARNFNLRDLEIHVVNSIPDISRQRRYIAFVTFMRVVVEPHLSSPNVHMSLSERRRLYARISNLMECMQSHLIW